MKDQEQWMKAFLESLLENDHRHIFTLAMFVPSAKIASGISPDRVSERCIRTNKPLDVAWFIQEESRAEAGSMAVSGKLLLPSPL